MQPLSPYPEGYGLYNIIRHATQIFVTVVVLSSFYLCRTTLQAQLPTFTQQKRICTAMKHGAFFTVCLVNNLYCIINQTDVQSRSAGSSNNIKLPVNEGSDDQILQFPYFQCYHTILVNPVRRCLKFYWYGVTYSSTKQSRMLKRAISQNSVISSCVSARCL